MATDTIQPDATTCKGAKGAYFEASCVLDELGMDLERLSETSFALAVSEAFSENAQHCLYLIGQMSERMRDRAKKEMQRFDEARGQGAAR